MKEGVKLKRKVVKDEGLAVLGWLRYYKLIFFRPEPQSFGLTTTAS